MADDQAVEAIAKVLDEEYPCWCPDAFKVGDDFAVKVTDAAHAHPNAADLGHVNGFCRPCSAIYVAVMAALPDAGHGHRLIAESAFAALRSLPVEQRAEAVGLERLEWGYDGPCFVEDA